MPYLGGRRPHPEIPDRTRPAGRLDTRVVADRKYWFGIGFNTGDPSQCNTFAEDALN